MTRGVEVGLLVIRSNDMHQLAEFYSAIGMQFEKHSHPPCGEHYSTIEGNCVFEICQLKQGQTPLTNFFFGLTVPDITTAVDAVIANHGEIVRPPESSERGSTAIIRDPEGHRVLLVQRQRSSTEG